MIHNCDEIMTRVLHFEIVTDDPVSTIKFYEKVFGWVITKWTHGEYWNIRTGDPKEPGIDGGMICRSDSEGVTVNSIYVDDIDKYLERIAKNGGEVTHPKRPITGVGWLAYFKDTEGTLWGLMQEDSLAK